MTPVRTPVPAGGSPRTGLSVPDVADLRVTVDVSWRDVLRFLTVHGPVRLHHGYNPYGNEWRPGYTEWELESPTGTGGIGIDARRGRVEIWWESGGDGHRGCLVNPSPGDVLRAASLVGLYP